MRNALLPRKFMILENVGNVLGKDMVEILEYIKQDFYTHNNKLISHLVWKVSGLILSHFRKAAMRRCLDLRWASVTGHMVGAPAWSSVIFWLETL